MSPFQFWNHSTANTAVFCESAKWLIIIRICHSVAGRDINRNAKEPLSPCERVRFGVRDERFGAPKQLVLHQKKAFLGPKTGKTGVKMSVFSRRRCIIAVCRFLFRDFVLSGFFTCDNACLCGFVFLCEYNGRFGS